MEKKGHLTHAEREDIFLLLSQGCSFREIGEKIRRCHTTVSREIEKNKGSDGRYLPSLAQEESKKRKLEANSRNPLKDKRTFNYVREKLFEGWSPEQISGRIGIDIPGLSISHETIYQYIYKPENKHLTLWVFLRRKQPGRVEKGGRKAKREIVPNRTFINERPEHINKRKQAGHWESDLMEGKKSDKSAVSASIERKSRLIILAKVEFKKAKDKAETIIRDLQKLPPHLRRSITFDNGSENARHEEIAKALGLKAYFTNPYHSWEKGTVENTIGLAREFFPKGESLEEITQRELNLAAQLLNNRPRKCLGFRTPSEVFYEELSGAFQN